MLSITESLLGYMRAGAAGTLGGGIGYSSAAYDTERRLEAQSIADAQRGIDPKDTYRAEARRGLSNIIRPELASYMVIGAIPAIVAYHQRRKAEKMAGL